MNEVFSAWPQWTWPTEPAREYSVVDNDEDDVVEFLNGASEDRIPCKPRVFRELCISRDRYKIRNWPDIRHDTIWDYTSTGISFPPAALGDLQIFATCSSSSCSSHYSRWHCMVGAVGIRERNCRHPSGATTNVTILKTNARP